MLRLPQKQLAIRCVLVLTLLWIDGRGCAALVVVKSGELAQKPVIVFLVQLQTGIQTLDFHPHSALVTPVSIARLSQALAVLQSRITVTTDTFRTSAVSSTLIPPKNRSSTTWVFR